MMTDTWTWATVTQATPLRIKVDGDTSALNATTDDLVGSLAVDDRVRVHLHADGIIVTGLQGGAAMPFLNVMDYGAKNDGTTDDTAAWTAAIAALPAGRGGTIFLPRGAGSVVNGSAVLDFSMHANVTLLGEGGSSVGGRYTNYSGDVASKIIATGVGSGSVVKMDGGYGLTIRNIGIVVSDPDFTGNILDLREVSAVTVTGKITIADCYIAGDATTRSGFGVNLDKTVFTDITRCTIVDCYYGASGKDAPGSFSNVVTIEETYFQNNRGAHIRNPGESWVLKNNTYEALSTGMAGSVYQDADSTCEALAVIGGWAGDVTSATPGYQFDFLGKVYGASFDGVFIGGTTASTAIRLNIGIGIKISGCSFHGVATAVDAASGVTGTVGPNAYVSMTGVNVSAPSMSVLDGAWTTYTPVWLCNTTNPAIGNGILTGAYMRIGKTVHYRIKLVAGSTTAFGSGSRYDLTLPTSSIEQGAYGVFGHVLGVFSGTRYDGLHETLSSVRGQVYFGATRWGTSAPGAFASGDVISIIGTYEEG